MVMETPVQEPIIEEEEDGKTSNAAWAEVMANILGKTGPKDKDTIILAKNKEKDEMDLELEKERKERKQKMAKKRKWEEMGHVKPDPLQKEYEKNLMKIATKGVVQLFNAVKKHQKQLNEEVRKVKTESRKDKVIDSINKNDFLDLVTGNGTSKKSATTKKSKDDGYKDAKKDKSWSVLQDSFMMGNKLRNWDQESEEEDVE